MKNYLDFQACKSTTFSDAVYIASYGGCMHDAVSCMCVLYAGQMIAVS